MVCGPSFAKEKPAQCHNDTKNVGRPKDQEINIMMGISMIRNKPPAQHQKAIDSAK